jgi:hypothetical protein
MHSFRETLARLVGRVPAFTLLAFLAAACGDPNGGSGDGGTTDVPADAGTDTFNGLGAVNLSGKVTYDFVPATYSPSTERGTLAFAQTAAKPVRNAVVQLRQGTAVLATTQTDEQGNYQLSHTSSTAGTMTLAVLAKTVSPSIQVEDNTDGNSIWGTSSTLRSATGTLNVHATHGWTGRAYDANKRVAAPFAVLDSMYTAAKAFMAVRTVNFPPLKVNWSPNNVPQSGDKTLGNISTSHYAFNEGEIYILGKEGADTDEFDSHVIVHEWAHYLEAQLSRSDSPGGQHGEGDQLDPRLAFSEGYGNAIAAMVLPETVYTDTVWGSTSGTWVAFGFDAETAPSPTDDPTPGGFSEYTVLRLLYDLYDSGTSESAYDGVALGLGPLYDVLAGPQKTTSSLTTVASFITGLKAQPGMNVAAVNTLLAQYQLGAITSDWGDGDLGLRGMYTRVSALPYNGSASLTGGFRPNTRQQNKYFTFTGTGAAATISATSSFDVGLSVYLRGQLVAVADVSELGTTETARLASTQADATYVVVLTGYKSSAGSYTATDSNKSP